MGPQIGVSLWSSKVRKWLVNWEIHQFLKRFHRNLHIFKDINDSFKKYNYKSYLSLILYELYEIYNINWIRYKNFLEMYLKFLNGLMNSFEILHIYSSWYIDLNF